MTGFFVVNACFVVAGAFVVTILAVLRLEITFCFTSSVVVVATVVVAVFVSKAVVVFSVAICQRAKFELFLKFFEKCEKLD